MGQQQSSSNGSRQRSSGLWVGSISIGLFGFILVGAVLLVVGIVACCSTPRLRRSFIDSPLNPRRPPPSHSRLHPPSGAHGSGRDAAVRALNGEHPWFEDPFVRLARERRELDAWRRAVGEEERMLREKPRMFERRLVVDEDDILERWTPPRRQERLPLGAQLVRPPSSSTADPSSRQKSETERTVIRTAVLIRLPCASASTAAVASAKGRSHTAAIVADEGDEKGILPEEGEEDLPELDFGLAYLELEGEWP